VTITACERDIGNTGTSPRIDTRTLTHENTNKVRSASGQTIHMYFQCMLLKGYSEFEVVHYELVLMVILADAGG
jgi:hypothetical protein